MTPTVSMTDSVMSLTTQAIDVIRTTIFFAKSNHNHIQVIERSLRHTALTRPIIGVGG
jgi:hypothetical protein